MTQSASEPQAQLERALQQSAEVHRHAALWADRFGNLRLALALLAVVLVLAPLVTRSGTPWWCLLPVMAVFLALARVQDSWIFRRDSAAASMTYLKGSRDRLGGRWRETGDTGADVGRPWQEHPLHFAQDLDLFGPASAFQLLCRARTRAGRARLARWLAEPAPQEEAEARQGAVRALAGALDLRRQAFVAAAGAGSPPLEDAALLAWARGEATLPAASILRMVGLVFPLALAVTAWVAFGAGGAREPFYIVAIAQVGLLLYLRGYTGPQAAVISSPERTLERYARLIEVVETLPETVSVGPLAEIKACLHRSGRTASTELRELKKIVELLDARLNPFFAASLGPALLWELNLVLRADRWRQRVGSHVEAWLEALGAFEALASMAALAFERPHYAFAEPADGDASFVAEALTHPLLDPRHAVGNDLTLGGQGSVFLLSGSNMSGKSTCLRSVGLATVFAHMGAPVAARRLRLAPLRLATSVRVVDSLAEGASHFYAELLRLKHVVDLARESGPPVLYLLDEVLHGTNSRERFIGSVSVLKWLAEHGAVGVITTHDLALGRVSEHLPDGRVVHAHFSDQVGQGDLAFDYRLRPGSIETTNALRLMRAVGIEIEMVEG